MKSFINKLRHDEKGLQLIGAMILLTFSFTLSGILMSGFGDTINAKLTTLGKNIGSMFNYTSGTQQDFDTEDIMSEKVLFALDSERLGGQLPEYYGLHSGKISIYIHSKSGTTHSLIGDGDNVVFTAVADWNINDTLTINNKPAAIYSVLGEKLEDTVLFKTGMPVRMSIRLNASTDSYDCYVEHTIKDYNLTYNLDGGQLPSGVTIESLPTKYTARSESFELPNLTKKGFIFSGWSSEKGANPQLNAVHKQGLMGNKDYLAVFKADKQPITFLSSSITTKTGGNSGASVGKESIAFGITANANGWHNIYLSQTIKTTGYSKLVINGHYKEGGSDSQGFIVVSGPKGEIHRQNCNAARNVTVSLNKTIDVSGADSVTFVAQLYVSGTRNWQDWAELIVNGCYLTN